MLNKTIIILFTIGLLSTGFLDLHKYYVSTTNIGYSEKEQSLQAISRIFTDDLEALLKTRYGIDANLGANQEHEEVDEFLQKYFSKKLKFTVNDTLIPLVFLGKEYETDIVKCYIELKKVGTPKTIKVVNQILFDLFEEQQNVMHFKIGEKQKSFITTKQKDAVWLKF